MISRSNRFEDFFQNPGYIALKNYLYNYILRRRSIIKSIQIDDKATLEIGSGMSPVITSEGNVIYCDLSFSALTILRKTLHKGFYVVADSTQLPFREGLFHNIVCSEVLEHIEDDRQAVEEIARILSSSGSLFITFPHRRFYFSCDDDFVRHLRRYELSEMKTLLKDAGLTTIQASKVLGPLEKIIMISITFFIRKLQCMKHSQKIENEQIFLFPIFLIFFQWFNRLLILLAWLDAKIIPFQYATVVMIKAQKQPQN